MIVLVDTSVWIQYLMDRPPYALGLDRLLSRKEVAGHELVYGELLIGDRGGRRKLLDDYNNLLHADRIPHDEVVVFVRERGFHGRGAGWIDVHLLASAVVSRMFFWTADERLAVLAREAGVNYELPGTHGGTQRHR